MRSLCSVLHVFFLPEIGPHPWIGWCWGFQRPPLSLLFPLQILRSQIYQQKHCPHTRMAIYITTKQKAPVNPPYALKASKHLPKNQCRFYQIILCKDHIEHTKLLLDNKRCPEFKKGRISFPSRAPTNSSVLRNGRTYGNLRGSGTGSN